MSLKVHSVIYRNIGSLTNRLTPALTNLNRSIRHFAGPTNFEKSVLDHWDLIPFWPFILYSFHKLGKAHVQGTEGDNKPIQDGTLGIGEGLLTKFLVDNTINVYPAMMVSWGIYRAGMEEKKTERLKSIVNTSAMFPLGYLGVIMGQWFTDLTRLWEAHNVSRMFSQIPRSGPFFKLFRIFQSKDPIDTRLGKLLSTPVNRLPSPELRNLHGLLKTLYQTNHKHLHSLGSLFAGSTPTIQILERDRKGYEAAVRNLLHTTEGWSKETLSRVDQFIINQTYRAPSDAVLGPLQKMTRQLSRSYAGYKQAARFLNPAFGYLMLTTFVALPVIKYISEHVMPKVTKTDPAQWHTTFHKDMTSNWLGHVVGLEDAKGGHHLPALHEPIRWSDPAQKYIIDGPNLVHNAAPAYEEDG